VWGPAKALWRDGHYKQAVSTAPDSVIQHLRSITERRDIPDTSLWQQVFSSDAWCAGRRAPADRACCQMDRGVCMVDEWRHVREAGVEFDVPVDMARAPDSGVEGPAVSFVGPCARLIVDRSPFADPLDRYAGRPEYSSSSGRIGDTTARVVSFRAEDGTRVVGARLPALTAVVHLAPDADPEIALRILRSIQHRKIGVLTDENTMVFALLVRGSKRCLTCGKPFMHVCSTLVV
jgi:hypothetical protein